MASKCKKPITIDNGPLRGPYKPGGTYRDDWLAETYPDYFDRVDDSELRAPPAPKSENVDDEEEGGDIDVE